VAGLVTFSTKRTKLVIQKTRPKEMELHQMSRNGPHYLLIVSRRVSVLFGMPHAMLFWSRRLAGFFEKRQRLWLFGGAKDVVRWTFCRSMIEKPLQDW
jgi:hypothetical protein